jgi:hypothetical protein
MEKSIVMERCAVPCTSNDEQMDQKNIERIIVSIKRIRIWFRYTQKFTTMTRSYGLID